MDNIYKHFSDPVFLVAIGLYSFHRFVITQFDIITSSFLSSYLNDILLVPVMLPILTFIASKIRRRGHNLKPTFREILSTLICFTIICEYIGPVYFSKGVADPLDILAYASGGFIAWIFWGGFLSFIQQTWISACVGKAIKGRNERYTD